MRGSLGFWCAVSVAGFSLAAARAQPAPPATPGVAGRAEPSPEAMKVLDAAGEGVTSVLIEAEALGANLERLRLQSRWNRRYFEARLSLAPDPAGRFLEAREYVGRQRAITARVTALR